MKGSIRQRNPGSWELQVFLGRGSNGKRLRKTETVHGKKSEAQRRLREILGDLDHGIAHPQKSYKLREWLELWMSEVIIPNRRQKIVDRYEGIIRLHIVPHLGNVEFSNSPRSRSRNWNHFYDRKKGWLRRACRWSITSLEVLCATR
jgi:integrase